ncbi:hypothetical protein [Rahnella aquatilis]|uniref:hypothetical protein n=1 Tax=Rahnella aquatilis TaxID=34038 RepID=UPI00364F5DF7
MKAKQFNELYPVGTYFIHHPCKVFNDASVVKTVDEARDFTSATVVEINVAPYFVNTKSLTPAD